MSHSTELEKPVGLEFVGEQSSLLSGDEIRAGISAAFQVFEKHGVNPEDCKQAVRKLADNELLTKNEAFHCLIWNEAEDSAFRAATLGWLARNVDIRLKI
ncbi:MAG: hypothetical protein HO274_00070 [Ferrovum myxofaciens]|uniref:hypothetical protein n=1 Tax=Ferrovum myxofaciens TaxID=416213 RepID=UPI002357F14D|nr:hypothetical protein [Ferrovum myxofaciens]QKE39906.1 MAG: hypothetical protein HO274_00070 [Ferrovum myxofaciens]